MQLNDVSTAPISLDIEVDTDKVLEEVVDFILGYNLLIERLNPDTLTSDQKRYLTPLSDDDVSMMSYTESDEYEVKYKLYNEMNLISKESSIRDFSVYMRQSTLGIGEGLPGAYSSLDVLGIEVGSTGSLDDQKMGYLFYSRESGQSDEEYRAELLETLQKNNTFLSALKDAPEEVYRLFGNNSETHPEYSHGIARKISEKIDDYIKTGGVFKEKTQLNGMYDRQLVDIYEQISFYKLRSESREQALYDQFARMETQMSQIQADSTSFLAQMGLE